MPDYKYLIVGGGMTADAAIPVEYPSVTFGTTEGSVIQNYSFQGFPDPLRGTDLQPVQLADFYNPAG